jgi:CO/xanthine dehydrogenase FAD-binding subunit
LDVKRKCPLLAEAVKWIGHPEIRNRGTVGGSLVHADPTAELALVAILLDSQVKIHGNGKSRTVGAADFFQGIMATSIAEDEILTEVSYPVAPARSGYGFRELCLRHGDFAVVAAAVQLTVGGNGRCTEARVAVAGAGPTPLRIRGAEEVLVGNNGTDEVFDAAAARVPGEVEPFSDLQGSEAYRREMARVFVRRALDDAWSRVKENH